MQITVGTNAPNARRLLNRYSININYHFFFSINSTTIHSKQVTHLKEHLITHGIGIKRKFPCSICQKEFLFQGALNQHMWVHKKGEARPHTCSGCGKGFIRRHKMVAHQIKEHSNAPNEMNCK